MVHDSIKSMDLGFMVQDHFSRPLFCVASAFWVYRDSVSVEQRQCLCGAETRPGPGPGPVHGPGHGPGHGHGYFLCIIIRYSLCIIIRYSLSRIIRYSLCGTDTVSLCGRHTVQGGGRVGVRGELQPHTGASQSPPHTYPKSLSRSCGGKRNNSAAG